MGKSYLNFRKIGPDATGYSSDFITLIHLNPYRTITGMQAPVFFLVRALFIALMANKIKIIAINGQCRAAIAMFPSAGMLPFAERGHGGFLFTHIISHWHDWQNANLSHCRHKSQYGKNTEINTEIECLACHPGKDRSVAYAENKMIRNWNSDAVSAVRYEYLYFLCSGLNVSISLMNSP